VGKGVRGNFGTAVSQLRAATSDCRISPRSVGELRSSGSLRSE